ncbi:MAG: hypothetical protein DMF65_06930 [Acidobacteria bacterium]|nr:MAG: hypothetical protein DMF65_06930 [Acidobacteriota bacterium]
MHVLILLTADFGGLKVAARERRTRETPRPLAHLEPERLGFPSGCFTVEAGRKFTSSCNRSETKTARLQQAVLTCA